MLHPQMVTMVQAKKSAWICMNQHFSKEIELSVIMVHSWITAARHRSVPILVVAIAKKSHCDEAVAGVSARYTRAPCWIHLMVCAHETHSSLYCLEERLD